jgi:branched-chain amino acid transport system permease protein
MGLLVVHGVIDGVLTGGVYALIAVGLTLILGVMNFLNVAQATFVIVGAYLSYTLQVHLGIDPFLGLLVTMPCLFLLGALVEKAFLGKLTGPDRLVTAILATYAVGIAIQGVLNLVYGLNYAQIQVSYAQSTVRIFGVYVPEIYLFGFALAVVLTAGVYLFLHRTKTGAAIRATMQNPRAAALVGIDVRRISTIAFGIGTALAAGGGMVFGATNAFNANSSEDLLSRMLAIVILGGLGSIGGALGAAVLMLVIEDVVALVWSPIWAVSVFYMVLVIVLLVRPRGLFGRLKEA